MVQMDYDCNVRQRALYVEPFTYFCAFFFQGIKVVNIKVGYRKSSLVAMTSDTGSICR